MNTCDPFDGCLVELFDFLCEDSDPCTVGYCDEAAGCQQLPLCDDGFICVDGACEPEPPCGGACAGATQCLDDVCTLPGKKLMFTTSTTHNGNLGGLAGADAICAARASEAGYGGTWVAWLSSSGADAKDRVADQPYYRVDGALLAASMDDLIMYFSGFYGLSSQPKLDENGADAYVPWGFSNFVWTGTQAWGGSGDLGAAGTFAGGGCGDWTSAAGSAMVGEQLSTSHYWTAYQYKACAQAYRLYCFQQ